MAVAAAAVAAAAVWLLRPEAAGTAVAMWLLRLLLRSAVVAVVAVDAMSLRRFQLL
jgi:hypothetical protein